MSEQLQQDLLFRIIAAAEALRGRLPLVDDYTGDMDTAAEALEALVEATSEE